MEDFSEKKVVGTLRYFGDPMCSWCWGFRPVLEQAEREYPELRRVTVLGGLRGEASDPMSDELMNLVRGAWMRIEETTGQPFNHDLWKNHRPLATTLPACRAVAAARVLKPEREWDFMVGMFKAYFTDAMDPTREETHLAVAEAVGFDPSDFERSLNSQGSMDALNADLQTTRLYGITGFPSVVLTLGEGASSYLISPGYQPIEGLRKAINAAYEDAGIELTRPVNGIYS